MPITNNADLTTAFRTGKSQMVFFNKNGGSSAANFMASLWRSGGHPTQPAIPTTAEVCDDTTPGGLVYAQPDAGKILYIGEGDISAAQNNHCIVVSDRLAHMGGLNMTLTTVQTVNVDIGGSGSNMAQRRGDYSEVLWWLQWYTATGGAATTVTVNYTATDDTTGSLTVSVTASTGANRMYSIPRPPNGKYIKRVDSIQSSTNTGTAGNVGVTAQRPIAYLTSQTSYSGSRMGPMELGLPIVHPKSCLDLSIPALGSSAVVVGGRMKLIEV